MRKILALLFLLLVLVLVLFAIFVMPAKAQDAAAAAAQINSLQITVNGINVQLKNLTDVVLPGLKTRRQTLDATRKTLKTNVSALAAKYVNLSNRMSAQQAKLERHSAEAVDRACTPCVTSYNAESARLDGVSASLRDESAVLARENQTIKQEFDQMERDSADCTAAIAKAHNDFRDLITTLDSSLKLLATEATVYASCMNKYPADGDAGLKRHCGDVQFDHIREVIDRLRHTQVELPVLPQ